MTDVQIAPAILCYTKEELAHRIAAVPDAHTLHIDIMDGKFVNNTTIGPDVLASFQFAPDKEIEYHLMVADPLKFIEALPGGKNKIFQVHLESVDERQIEGIRRLVKKKGGRLAWVVNPPTLLEKLEKHLSGTDHVLLMTVNPGWAGQSYISDVEEKMRALRARHPHITIEIDGGIGPTTIPRAIAAGANRFAAASAVFGQSDPNAALRGIIRLANPSKP